MPTQLQLEGPELEPLLARVRADHGSSARIVQAEKVRSGGVGGFFAKQRFEITVEVDDTTAAPAPAPAPRVTSILDLADEVSAGERAAAVSTESTGFAAVLARLGATAGEPPAPAIPQQRQASSPQTPRAGGASEHLAAAAALLDPAPTPRRRRTDAPAPTEASRPAPQPPARRTRVIEAAPVPRRAVAARPAASATGVTVRTVRAPGAAAAPGTAVAVRTSLPVKRVASAVAVRPAAAPPRRTASVARSAGTLETAARQTAAPAPTDVQAQLAQLGLPTHLQPRADGGALRAALVESLRALPRAPRTPDKAGSLLAIVGPLAHATDVARQVARELDLPRSSVVVAGASLRTENQARTSRASWARRSRTTVVVLDTPLTAAGALRTRALLDALEPSSTWGVVEATRKPRDVGAWTRAIGRVDALALTGVDETADPASVLELGIPVGRVGARKATPALWADLLSDRVAA